MECQVDYRPAHYEYLLKKMPKMDDGLMRIHFQLYEGYVKQVNLLNRLLQEELSKPNGGNSFQYQAIKRQFGWEFNGMVLHELYFSNLGAQDKINKNSLIYRKIKEQWGSFDKWFEDFKQTCMVRGVGWTILYYDAQKNMLYNSWISDHADGPLVTGAPILVIDLWEHAYLCQFGTNRGRYIDTIFEYVDWNLVNSRLKCAVSSSKAKEVRKPKALKASHEDKSDEKK